MKFKFPSIRQYREVIKEYSKAGYTSKVKIIGRPKLHGCNVNICFYEDGTYTVHGKDRLVTPEENLFGILEWVEERHWLVYELGRRLKEQIPSLVYPFVACFEYAGGHIQSSKCSVYELPEFLMLFQTANIVEEEFQHVLNNFLSFQGLPEDLMTSADNQLYDVREFGQLELTLDMVYPENLTNELADATVAWERECPIAKYFGVMSDRGEGVVWHCEDNQDRHLYFKVKGKKHSGSKVRTLAKVSPERLKTLMDFVEYDCTIPRMEQAVNETGEISRDNRNAFLNWLHRDIVKEESDTLAYNQLEYKDVMQRVTNKALEWYIPQMG